MMSRALARLLTGPLAFLLGGVIDVVAYSVQSGLTLARRRLGPSTMPRR